MDGLWAALNLFIYPRISVYQVAREEGVWRSSGISVKSFRLPCDYMGIGQMGFTIKQWHGIFIHHRIYNTIPYSEMRGIELMFWCDVCLLVRRLVYSILHTCY